jgi:hypothetical protein
MKPARKDKFTNKIDPRIKDAVANYGDKVFNKPKVLKDICCDSKITNILARVEKEFPGWGIDIFVKEAIQNRVDRFLQQRDKRGVRLFECYAVGHGPRNWVRFEGMTTAQLRVCIQWRREHISKEQDVLRGYERALELLEKIGETAKVSAVYNLVFAK